MTKSKKPAKSTAGKVKPAPGARGRPKMLLDLNASPVAYIAYVVYNARMAKNLTNQQDIADLSKKRHKLPLTVSEVVGLERGEPDTRLSVIVRVCQVLGLDPTSTLTDAMEAAPWSL